MSLATAAGGRRPRVVLAAVTLVLAGIIAGALFQQGEVGLDDVFITYRYAQNLAEGQGFVFNPGERVFGTTAPGFALLLAGVHRLSGLSIPASAVFLTGLSALVIGLFVFLHARAAGRGLEAFGGAVLLASTTYLWVHAGSEIPFALALLMVAARILERRPTTAGLVAAFAVWCRPDALLGAGVVALLEWRARRRLPWRYGVTVGLGVAAGLVLAWIWFGVPLPSTLEAKRVQASLGAQFWASGLSFWGTGYQALSPYMVEPEQRFAFWALALLGGPALWCHGGRSGRVLVGTAAAYLLAFPLLGVPYYTWYSLPVVIALCFGFSFAAGELARRTHAFFGAGRAGVALALLFVLTVFGATTWRLAVRGHGVLTHRAHDPRYHFYREVGEWLGANARPGDELAFVEVGTIAFYSRLPLRDQLGLVSPESLPFLAARDLAGAFLARPTSLYLADEKLGGFTGTVPSEPWFAPAFKEEKRFPSAALDRTLVVYRRVPEVPLPPSRPPLRPN